MGYYVSVQDGNRSALVAGPFRRHGDALRAVRPVMNAIRDAEPRAHFYAWGTAHHKTAHAPARFNDLCGISLKDGWAS